MSSNSENGIKFGSAEYDQAKSGLLEYLRGFSGDRNLQVLAFGSQTFSINEMQSEVEKDTVVGRTHVEMFFNDQQDD